MTVATRSIAGQLYGLAVYTPPAPPSQVLQLYGLAAYAPHEAHHIAASQVYGLAVYRLDTNNLPIVSQLYAMAVYASGLPQEARSRAWAFTLDGHPFYVLDLGDEGTFLYDQDTRQWCQWQTSGYTGWNVRNGTRWSEPERIVGGDTTSGIVWELDPDLFTDEGFRDITHVSTAGVLTRERVYHAVEAVRLAGSMGNNTNDTASSVTLEFSDDGGQTYPYSATVTIGQGDFSGVVEWRSLGSFRTPGRVFRVTDVGGLLRIDGADVYIDNWDDEGQPGGDQQNS